MSKTTAQILREHMDAINGATQPVVEAVPSQSFDFETTVTNPLFNAPNATEDTPEEIEVGVNYSISGRYYPATMEQPAEYPELEILDVVNLETGADITAQLSKSDMQRIEEKAWEQAEEAKRQSEEDAAADRYYDRMDRSDLY